MRIKLSEPSIVAMGPCTETAGWGVYQFPDLWKLPDGRILYSFHLPPSPRGNSFITLLPPLSLLISSPLR